MHALFKQGYATIQPVLCCKALSDFDYFSDHLTSFYDICNVYRKQTQAFMQIYYNDDKQPQNNKRSFGPGYNLITCFSVYHLSGISIIIKIVIQWSLQSTSFNEVRLIKES